MPGKYMKLKQLLKLFSFDYFGLFGPAKAISRII